MEESGVLRLLEHTAVRYETTVDYKVWRELIDKRMIGEFEFPGVNRLKILTSGEGSLQLSERSLVRIGEAVRSRDKILRAVDRYYELTVRHGIRVIGADDERYPIIWKYLSGMPPVIFLKGDESVLYDIDRYGSAAIVGSRSAGRYALYATGEFSSKLCARRAVIVSGLAMGIDRKAHEACLNAGGRTLAVVPGGCDMIYPFQNADIYDRICQTGAVLSELPPGQEVIKQYFPSRNRLISALSDVCLIMEAGIHSGTLHTASFAANQGRDVFVLPNSIYAENSIGGLLLLKDGAEVLIDDGTVYERIVTELKNRAEEVRDHYHIIESSAGERDIGMLRGLVKDSPESISEPEWKMIICDEISERPKNIDELAVSLGIPFSYLSALVTGLETEGMIANEKGKYVLTIHGC